MFSTSVAATVLLAASSVIATPFPRSFNFGGFRPSPSPKGGCCSIANLTIPNLNGLTAPSGAPSFVAIGLGTQNYTCSSAGTYTSTGAVADIHDIACLSGTAAFTNIQDTVLKSGIPKGAPLLGKHFFISNAGALAPKWDFTASQKNANAFVVGHVDVKNPAPTGAQDVPWLQLSSTSGSLASSIFRLDTRLGQPPATCTPGTPDITVKYSAKYWFFGSSLKAAVQA